MGVIKNMDKENKTEKPMNIKAGLSIFAILILVLITALGLAEYKNQRDINAKDLEQITSLKQEIADLKGETANPEASDQTESATDAGASSCDETTSVCISEWGIALKFKDADKVTYEIYDQPGTWPSGNSDEYLATAKLKFKSGTVVEGCENLGITVLKLKTATDTLKTSYPVVGGPGLCANEEGTSGPTNTLISNVASNQLGTDSGYSIEEIK